MMEITDVLENTGEQALDWVVSGREEGRVIEVTNEVGKRWRSGSRLGL